MISPLYDLKGSDAEGYKLIFLSFEKYGAKVKNI
jgi:hypothetical protein